MTIDHLFVRLKSMLSFSFARLKPQKFPGTRVVLVTIWKGHTSETPSVFGYARGESFAGVREVSSEVGTGDTHVEPVVQNPHNYGLSYPTLMTLVLLQGYAANY